MPEGATLFRPRVRRRPTIAAPRRALVTKREHSIPGGAILRQTIKQVFLTRRTKGGRPSTPRRQVLALRAVHDHIPARSARILAFPCLGRPPFVLRVKNTYLLSCWLDFRPAAKPSRKMNPRCCPARWTNQPAKRAVDSFIVGCRLIRW